MKMDLAYLEESDNLLAQFETEGHLPLDWNEDLSLEEYLVRLDQQKG